MNDFIFRALMTLLGIALVVCVVGGVYSLAAENTARDIAVERCESIGAVPVESVNGWVCVPEVTR